MKHYSRWFGLGPYDDYEGYHYHWYNRHREWAGERYRISVGDLAGWNEAEHGGHRAPQFSIELTLSQDDVSEFDEYAPLGPKAELVARYDVHYFSIMFWRWGIIVAVRGRVSEEQ